MSLKQSIVVVNEFSEQTSNGGSRGSTPGSYVERYMARKGAVEDVAPVRLYDADAFITRYMAREGACERAEAPLELAHGLQEADKDGGVAFGPGCASLSHEAVHRRSKRIQAAFDKGHTVMKTVISFEAEYLREMNVIDADFEAVRRGDYRGNIDQMKLRLAIMEGLERMSRNFDDLDYVGVIQVDTLHVHCHLCMVDQGEGRLAKNGNQRGKLTQRDMRELRRGIDDTLQVMSPIRQMASNITQDRRNARCFMKRLTHRMACERGAVQFLIACLPEDRRQWRAASNRKEMRKPNQILGEIVDTALALPESGGPAALREIEQYANARAAREGLTDKERYKLIENGHDRLRRECMDGVYSMLKGMEKTELPVRTPMLKAMSMPFDEAALASTKDDIAEFGFRLRSYSSRLDHHRRERKRYKALLDDFEVAERTEAAEAWGDHLKAELKWHEGCMAKYLHFLNFVPPQSKWERELEDIERQRTALAGIDGMIKDKSMKRMDADAAEAYGRDVYGVAGGRFAVTAPDVLPARRQAMEATLEGMRADLLFKLAEDGLELTDDDEVQQTEILPFDDVKALDIHHLGWDFPYDAPISKRNAQIFVDAAEERRGALLGAMEYLRSTGQSAEHLHLPTADVKAMTKMADAVKRTYLLKSERVKADGGVKRSATVRLDRDLRPAVETAIQTQVESVVADLESEGLA